MRLYNKSKTQICYDLLIQQKYDGRYVPVAAGGEIKSGAFDNPIVRGSIENTVHQYACDSTLYIIYFDLKDKVEVYKDMGRVIFTEKVKTVSVSTKFLDSLNWVVSYH